MTSVIPVHGKRLFLGLGKPTFCLPVQRKQAAVLDSPTCLYRSISLKELSNKENTLPMVTEKRRFMLPVLELFLDINIFVHPHIKLYAWIQCRQAGITVNAMSQIHRESEPNHGLSKLSFYMLLFRVCDLYTLLLKAAPMERCWFVEGQRNTFTSWLG